MGNSNGYNLGAIFTSLGIILIFFFFPMYSLFSDDPFLAYIWGIVGICGAFFLGTGLYYLTRRKRM